MNGPDIFLSYNREDTAVARLFAEALSAAGFDVWWDQSLRSGETYDEVTESALREAKAVVVLWSPRSVLSRWVRSEATIADRQKKLLPATIEPCERPIMFELTQTAELSHWRGDRGDSAWLALINDVTRLVGANAALTAPATPVPAAATPKSSTPSVLVIPFVNMSGESEQEFFTDGVTEDIITDLSRIAAISVVSRNKAFSFKGRTISADMAVRELGVDFLLEGSVRKVGNRVRITAQLLDTRNDTQVWGERFDRTLDDVFAIQDDIAQALVATMRLKLAPAEREALIRRATSSSEAYALYQMARQFNRSGGERIMPAVIRICRRALEIDPEFADAWALMSLAESEISQRGLPGYSHQSAFEAAEKAIAADPDCAEAHAAMAECLARGPKMNWAKARISVERALALDPESYDANITGGYGCISARDYEGSIRYFERALEIDPRGLRAAGMVLQSYRGAGDDARTRAAARRAVALMEDMLAREPDHGTAIGFLVGALATLDETERARDWANRAVLLDPDNSRMLYNVACAMAELNDVDAAIGLLEVIVPKVSESWILWMQTDNDMDPLRGDPRFQALLERGQSRPAN